MTDSRKVDASNKIQRISVYGICVIDDEILLVRASALTEVQGRWFLPGGGVDHGEHPDEALMRELKEETGLNATLGKFLGVVSDLRTRSDGVTCHTVRLIYEVIKPSGLLTNEVTGSSDQAKWVPLEDIKSLPVANYAIEAMALIGLNR